MPVTVKKITLWRAEIENKPGTLAQCLAPLAGAGVDLQVLMGYRIPADEKKAVVEVFPVTGKKVAAVAQGAGMSAAAVPTLQVQGDNKPGLGHAIAQAVAEAGININFLIAQVVGATYSAVIGLDNEEDAKTATAIIKKVAR